MSALQPPVCRSSRRRDGQRGAVAILAAVFLVLIGAFLALGLNVGNLMSNRAQAQAAADAAALAGAFSIDGTSAGVTAAQSEANAFATSHFLNADRVVVSPGTDILTGIWNPATLAFTASSDATKVNAVRVTVGRDTSGTRNSALPVYFGMFLGNQSNMSVHGSAVAAAGGPETGCSLPLAIAKCKVMDQAGNLLNCGASQTLVFSNANRDNVGFTNLDPGNRAVDTNGVIKLLNGTSGMSTCSTDPASGLPCCDVSDGDALSISNGNNLTKQMADAFTNPTNGPAGGYVCNGGSCPHVMVPILDFDDCSNPQFVGTHGIVGFATFTISAVSDKANSVTVTLLCNQKSTGSAGGGSFGTYGRPRLVQ